MAVKIPALLHKMSQSAQKAWYKKNNMEMPSTSAQTGGKSAAAAKRVKVAPRKASDVKPDSVRAINAARQAAYMAKGGRAPIGAAGSGGSSVMAGSNMSTAKGIIAGIKAGYNPRVSLNPYEGMTKKEKEAMKKEGVQIDKIVKAKTPSMREIDAALDAEKKGKPGPANKLRDIMRAKKAAQAQSSKEWAATRPAQKFPVYEPGRRYVGDSVELDGPVIDEVTKKEAEAVLGGPVKAKPKMPPGKQPAGYRYVRGLARKAMKDSMKKEEVEQVDEGSKRMSAAVKLQRAFDREKAASDASRKRGEEMLTQARAEYAKKQAAKTNEEVEQVDEAKLPHVATFVPLKRHIENKSLRDAIHIPVNVAHGDKSHKEKLVKKIGAEKAAMYKLHGVFPKRVDEEVEQVDEKLTAADPASKWISDFVNSDNPKFAGKSKKERIQQALGAYYAAKGGKNEEVEQVDELKKSTLASYVGKAAGRLAAASRLQKDFEKDGHTELAGNFEKSARKKKAGIQMAANKLAKEEAEGKTPETDTEVSLAKMHGNPKKITYGDVVKARIASAKKKALNKG